MVDKLESKFIGSLIGTGLGDSIGRSREGRGMISVNDVHELAEKSNSLRYTDDTQQMISLAESLVEGKGFNGKLFADRLVENFEISRGYGPGAVNVIKSLKDGVDWYEPAQQLFGGEGSYGNGSSMRVAPVGLFGFEDLNYLKGLAKESSKVTHTHKLGIEGAVLQALAVGIAVKKDSSNDLNKYEFVNKLKSFVESEIYLKKLDKIRVFLDKSLEKRRIITELGNGVEAYNSVPTAIYSFLSNIETFEEALGYSISLGGDADTIGAMTGAISGSYHGIDKLPEEWIKKLEHKEKIIKLAEELFKVRKKTKKN